MSKIIGIDLGTTYSAIAQLDDLGNPEVLSSTDENRKKNLDDSKKNINGVITSLISNADLADDLLDIDDDNLLIE